MAVAITPAMIATSQEINMPRNRSNRERSPVARSSSDGNAHGGGVVRAVLVWEVPYGGLATSMAQGPYGLPNTTILEEQASLRLQSCIEALGDTSAVEVRAEVLLQRGVAPSAQILTA